MLLYKLLMALKLKQAAFTAFMQIQLYGAAEVLEVIGNRGRVLFQTKLRAGEGGCLHSGTPARLRRVWLWHYTTYLICPIELSWQPL